ncbi:nuclear transport factor 2 family protein [Epilithonimonas xixisoli]|uniref:Ketosteroid isomerase-like protein n=1 Tax=Epilithonimonas xixisoli TaxID=1476462 RepID=A0A4R8I4M9_9FLAO|nr:nuclear transport factor 2 family protein [Epilithonimonas xixisoli]TDX83274.1 ketosteroid isomerase-like protein [Epilithonimonas xixisoli]
MKAIKILISGMIFCAMVISCNNSNENIQAENEKLIENYFKLFNEHKWKELSELYVENAEFKDPSFGNGIVKQSKAEFVKKYTELNQVFPDLKDKVIQVYPSGDKNIIVEFVSTGTAPDQSKFELPISTIFTIENGKITKDYTYYDNFEEAK